MKFQQKNKTGYGWVVICFLVFVMMGCAANEKMEPLPTAVPQNLIEKIALETSDEGTTIVIEGATPLSYTFFRIIPQPLTLVVDIPQAELAPAVTSPIEVGDEIIDEISAVQHEESVEVSISLNKLVKYQVQKEGNYLYVDMGKHGPLLTEEEGKKADIEIVQEMPPPTIKEEVLTKTSPPAQNLVDVVVDSSQQGRIILQLKADGTLGDYNTFDLKKPTRLVIDLWKVKRRFGKKELTINSPFLKKVRLGDHPKKVRVVLDCPRDTLPSHRIDRIGNNVVIVLGTKEAVAEAIPPDLKKKKIAKEEEKGAPLPTAITGELTGIDFKQLEDKSRIIISTPVKAPYEVKEGGENTVLVEIKGMTVPEKLSRPLDTQEFTSPVSIITPLNIKVGDQKSAQISVKLRKMVAYDVNQEDGRIYIDFVRTEEFIGEEKPKPVEVVTVKKAPAEEVTPQPEEVTPAEKPVKKVEPEKEEAVTPATQPPEPDTSPAGEIDKVYTGKKITLDFKDADIDNILRLFAEVSDLNIITTEEVKGTVTIRLVDVPWDQALDIVLDAKNLGMERIGNVIRIAPYETIQRDREAKALALKAQEELAPFVTELIPLNYSSATDLAPQVKDILSDGGSIKVDERTNTLIIKDTQVKVDKAKELIRRLDTQTPQVLIQAQIIEASTDFSRELGIQWGGRADLHEGEYSSMYKGGLDTENDPEDELIVDLPAAVGTGSGGAIEFAISNIKNLNHLKAQISALEEQGRGRILSSPRITTLDHSEASIEQGLRVPYPAKIEDGEVSYEYIEANLKLVVTPHVTGDGYIRMELKVSKDSPDYSQVEITGIPAIDKKEAVTEVLVKDGEVVVIGGIYSHEESGPTIAGVPFLYKIPLLGWLFHKRSKSETKKELIIFIAPSIVQPRRIATP